MTPVQASKKLNGKKVFSNLQDWRVRPQPKLNVGELLRIAATRNDFSKVDSRNSSYELYTITEVIHYKFPSNRINYLPERYKEIQIHIK